MKKNRKFRWLFAVTALIAAAAAVFLIADRQPAYGRLSAGETEKTKELNSLILVNGKNAYRETPSELVTVLECKSGSYFVKDSSVTLKSGVIEPLNRMMNDFQRYSGEKTVNVISGYRSAQRQADIFDQKTKLYGRKYAKAHVQKPYESEHQTGLAVDLSVFHQKDGTSEDFDGTGKYAWFAENCHKYGFILRYPEDKKKITGIAYEPWHFRYVGVLHAEYMKENNLCLEEYVELLRNGLPLTLKDGRNSIKVYYSRTEPEKADGRTVSKADNGGFIAAERV